MNKDLCDDQLFSCHMISITCHRNKTGSPPAKRSAGNTVYLGRVEGRATRIITPQNTIKSPPMAGPERSSFISPNIDIVSHTRVVVRTS